MRKITIFGLIALLLFVMPVAASDTAPSLDEGEDSSIIVLLNQYVEQVTDWYQNFQNSVLRETVLEAPFHHIEQDYLQDRMSSFLQRIRINALND